MKQILFLFLIGLVSGNTGCKVDEQKNERDYNDILKVPNDFPTIAIAIDNAESGDLILLAPGTYYEKNIDINKAVTVSSEWKLTGEQSKISETIIDAGDEILFNINADSIEISGLSIINGDHTLNISANVKIMHNRFKDNLDGMSFESGGGGYVGFNYAENDRDDALDLDIIRSEDNKGSDIIIEHNTFINCNDDGIEIRLFTFPFQNIHYIIRENTITGSNNAGIQLISYDVYTGKVFHIHNNIITGCKTGLGCMEGSNTSEDLSGASKMDEKVFFYNNTVAGNQMGATGGNNVIALNNVIAGNDLGGFKRFGSGSFVINNLFYQNGVDDYIELNEAVVKNGNVFSKDPLLDNNTYTPGMNSPCIDAGSRSYEFNGTVILEIVADYFTGTAPDIGAVEYGNGTK